MIARLFAYTRQLELERDFLRSQVAALLAMNDREFARSQEMIDSMVFHRMPKRLIEQADAKPDIVRDWTPGATEAIDLPAKPPTWSQTEYDEWAETLNSTDPLTRADMLAEHEVNHGG